MAQVRGKLEKQRKTGICAKNISKIVKKITRKKVKNLFTFRFL